MPDPFDDGESGTGARELSDLESGHRIYTDEKEADTSGMRELVPVPRWVLYAQGALLGLAATMFFVFGLAVGNATGSGSANRNESGTCVVSGAVYFDENRERKADHGSVVMLLPVDVQPRVRPEGRGLRPDQFEPVRNDALDEIRALGGCVVRVDQDGNYSAEIDGGRSYWWLVISNNQQADDDSIGKQTRAELGTWFLPIEELLGDRQFAWSKVRISGASQRLQNVTF